MNIVAHHYDILVDEGQDPVHDPKILQDYMDKWDGQRFIDELHLDKSKSVLEIGVGTGRVAVRVAPFCRKFTGIDVSEKTILKARENLDNVILICGDFLEYRFGESFDVIYSTLTFQHIKEKQKAFDKVCYLLCDSGRFVLSVDKNTDRVIDAGYSAVEVYPDLPCDIKLYADKAGLKLFSEFETDFAFVFVFEK